MSRPSPQEQAASELRDCRTCGGCAHWFEQSGTVGCCAARGFGCSSTAKAEHCDSYAPKPAPASPPVSADREGTDLLDVLREVRDVLLLSDPVGVRAQAIAGLPEDPAVADLCERWGYGAVMDSAARQWRRKDRNGAHTTGAAALTVRATLALIDRAISSEEARREAQAKELADLRAEMARDRALLGRCATEFGIVADYLSRMPGDHPMADSCLRRIGVLAAALRSAGVEPTPAQESIEKDDLGPGDWGDPREEKWPR